MSSEARAWSIIIIDPSKLKKSIAEIGVIFSLFAKNTLKKTCYYQHPGRKVVSYLGDLILVSSICLGIIVASITNSTAAEKTLDEENKIFSQMLHQVPLSHLEIYHGQDWQEFMEISRSCWGDSTSSLLEKFDQILGEEGKLTQFYLQIFKDQESVRLYQQLYVEINCRVLIAHYKDHSRNSSLNYFRCPYEIDVITKLETYAIRRKIPLFQYYHQELGFNEASFSGVEKMNEELVEKLKEQELARLHYEQQIQMKKIPPPPLAPPIGESLPVKRYKPLSSAVENSEQKKLLERKNGMSGAYPTLTPDQLNEILTKKLKPVSREELIQPIIREDFSSLLLREMEKRRKEIKDDEEDESQEF